MKQKDIATIIVVAFIAAISSYLIANRVFVTPENRQQTVEVIDVLTDKFGPPDTRFFNDQSINPTRDTGLDSTNQTPFNGASQ